MNEKRTLNVLSTALLLVLAFSMVTTNSLTSLVSATGDNTSYYLSPITTTITAGSSVTFTLWEQHTMPSSFTNQSSSSAWSVNSGAGTYTWSGNTLTVTKAGTWTVTGTYNGHQCTSALTVTAAAQSSLILVPLNGTWTDGTPATNKESNITAGDWLRFRVNTIDTYGNPIQNVTNQVTRWTLYYAGGQYDAVNQSDSIQITKSGVWTLNAFIDTSVWTLNSITLNVTDGPANELRYSYLEEYASAGAYFDVSVYVSDTYGNQITTYTGDVPSLNSSDPQADIVLTYQESGYYTFNVSLNSIGAQTLSINLGGFTTNTANVYVFQFVAFNTELGANCGLAQGSYGDTLFLSAMGLKPNSTYEVAFSTSSLANVTTDASGCFNYTAEVLEENVGGYERDIYLTDNTTGCEVASIEFLYQSSIALSASSGPKDSPVNVTVHGCPLRYPLEDSIVTATFNGQLITLNDAQEVARGSFTSAITIPNLTAGTYNLTIIFTPKMEPESIGITPFKEELAEPVEVTTQFTVTTANLTATVNGQSSGHVGDTLTITGTGLSPNTTYTLNYGDLNSSNVTTDSSGAFAFNKTILPTTRYTVNIVLSQFGNKISETQFALLPSIQLNVTSGLAGTTVSVVGNGFTASDPTTDGLAATLGSQTVTLSGLVSNGLGDFNATFTVPSISAGTYDFKVTDNSSDSAKVVFQVTAASSSSSSSSSSSTSYSSPTTTPTPTPTTNTIIATETSTNQTYSVTLSGNVTSTQMSNMTITAYQASSTTVVAFTVTGEHGTQGFGNLTISKSAIPYGTIPVIYIDDVQATSQGYTEDTDNYYVWYITGFSTHTISIEFTSQANATTQPTPTQDNTTLIVGIVVLIVALAVVALVYKYRKKSNF